MQTDQVIKTLTEIAYPFRWEKLRKTRGDYGTRVGLVCNQCESTVFKGSHAGRPVDERYFFHIATDAATAHLATHKAIGENNAK